MAGARRNNDDIRHYLSMGRIGPPAVVTSQEQLAQMVMSSYKLWVNYQLSRANLSPINNFRQDLSDGVVIGRVLRIVANINLPINENPQNNQERLGNATAIVAFLEENHLNFQPISPEGVAAGDAHSLIQTVVAIATRFSTISGQPPTTPHSPHVLHLHHGLLPPHGLQTPTSLTNAVLGIRQVAAAPAATALREAPGPSNVAGPVRHSGPSTVVQSESIVTGQGTTLGEQGFVASGPSIVSPSVVRRPSAVTRPSLLSGPSIVSGQSIMSRPSLLSGPSLGGGPSLGSGPSLGGGPSLSSGPSGGPSLSSGPSIVRRPSVVNGPRLAHGPSGMSGLGIPLEPTTSQAAVEGAAANSDTPFMSVQEIFEARNTLLELQQVLHNNADGDLYNRQAMQRELDQVRNQLRELDQAYQEASDQLHWYQQELQRMTTLKARFQATVVDQEDTIRNQEDTIRTAQAEIIRLETQRNNVEAQRNNVETQRLNLEALYVEARDVIAHKDTLIMNLRRDLHLVFEELDHFKQRCETHESQHQRLQNQMTEMNQTIDRLERSEVALEGRNQAYQLEIRNLEECLSAHDQELRNAGFLSLDSILTLDTTVNPHLSAAGVPGTSMAAVASSAAVPSTSAGPSTSQPTEESIYQSIERLFPDMSMDEMNALVARINERKRAELARRARATTTEANASQAGMTSQEESTSLDETMALNMDSSQEAMLEETLDVTNQSNVTYPAEEREEEEPNMEEE